MNYNDDDDDDEDVEAYLWNAALLVFESCRPASERYP